MSYSARRDQAFRVETAKLSMVGVMVPTFRCRKCKVPRPVVGRKKLAGEGYQCAHCAGEISNAKAVKIPVIP